MIPMSSPLAAAWSKRPRFFLAAVIVSVCIKSLFHAFRDSVNCHDDDCIVSFALAQKQILAEEQIARADETLRIRLADIVYVNPAAFNVLACLPLGRAQTTMN